MSIEKSFINKHLRTIPEFRFLFSEFYGKLYLLNPESPEKPFYFL